MSRELKLNKKSSTDSDSPVTSAEYQIFRLFAALQSKDDYSYRHSVGVGIVATLIGKWLILNKSFYEMIMINPLDPSRPLVRVEESFVDLSKESALHIERVTA